jgi:hypothetical protein
METGAKAGGALSVRRRDSTRFDDCEDGTFRLREECFAEAWALRLVEPCRLVQLDLREVVERATIYQASADIDTSREGPIQ